MISFPKLFRYIRRFWWLIILVPTLAVGVTYYFVRDLPDSYQSQAYISTGTSEMARIGALQGVGYTQSRQFYSNIIGMMMMKRVVNAVSFRLIIHDLESADGKFRPYSAQIDSLTAGQRHEAIQTYYKWLTDETFITDKRIGGISLHDIIRSMGYHYDALTGGIGIFRNGDSDFITVRFTSENPDLSTFIVNTLSNEFIQYYNTSSTNRDVQSVALLDSVVKEKERIMQERNSALRDYRVGSGILNSSTQSGILYQQIAGLETKRSEKLAEIESIRGTIADINKQLNDPANTLSLSNRSAYNNEIVMLDQQLELANKRYIDNNFKLADKRIVDSLQEAKRTIVANMAASQPIENPQQARQQLQQRLVEMQTALSLATNSMGTIDSDLASARSRYNAMVPMDASLQSYEREAELATKAYQEALDRYNHAGYTSNVGAKISVVEYGVPGPPLPSKRIIFMGLSGVASLVICLMGISLLFFLDRKISTPEELEVVTQSKNLAILNRVSLNGHGKSIQQIWEESSVNQGYAMYKDRLRTLRFDLQKELLSNNYRTIGITSLGTNEGKSFVTGSLAYAFALTGKKVLVIGEDMSILVKAGGEKEEKKPEDFQQFETFLIERQIQTEDLITNLRRNVENTSILEAQDRNQLTNGFKLLRETFDLILIDIGSFTDVNNVKEWLLFSDISLAVFQSGKPMPKNYQTLIGYLKEHPGFRGWILNKV